MHILNSVRIDGCTSMGELAQDTEFVNDVFAEEVRVVGEKVPEIRSLL